MSLAAGTRLGAYEVVSQIGAGGMGEVYRARDTRLNRDVAIKVLPDAFVHDADRLARFKREAQVLASLNHPHIAAIYGVEEGPAKAGHYVLILELVEGPTLADRIAQGPLPIDEALPIARQIAEALEAAHEHGIVHRDLKPSNIKLTADDKVKVLDFGLAKATDRGPVDGPPKGGHYVPNASMSPTITSPAMTMGGVILGTAAYMSPEQAKGKQVDKRSDVWAFGCVLYEMLTGKRAFEGEDVSDTLAAILRGEPDWALLPANVPNGIALLLRRCLEKDRKRRIGDISTVLFVLNEPGFLAPTGSLAAPIQVDTTRTRRMLWAASLIAVTAASAAVAMFLRPTAAADPERRLSIAIPHGAGIAFLAVSPDGRRVALVMRADAEGQPQIWVRSLDSHDFHALPGTFNSRAPFFSPDGRMIGFFADGKLKVVAVSGGPAQELCDGTGLGGGGTWSREGVILFGRRGSPGIMRVDAAGGRCTEVTNPAPGTNHAYPAFLPDGNHFLYVSTGEATNRGIHIASLSDPARARRLLADPSSAIVAPESGGRQGHVLFVRESTLMAQPFDFRSLEMLGDAVPVAQRVSPSSDPLQGAASISENGVLVYISGAPDVFQLTWFDRESKELQKVGIGSTQRGIVLSPDERTVLFSRDQSVWRLELARGVETSLGQAVRSPVWSPDGANIALVADSSVPGSNSRLIVKEIGSGKETLLIDNATGYVPSDWSRDGRHLLYTDINPKTQGDIWFLENPANPGRGKPLPFLVTSFLESQAQLSPDGRWVAYTSNESGVYAVYVSAFPSGSGKRRVSPGEAREPRWRSDGRELYYLGGSSVGGAGGRHRVMAVPVESTLTDLSLGAPTLLFEFQGRSVVPQGNVFQYAPGIGGRRFLVNVFAADSEPALHVITNWRPPVTN